MHPTLLGLFLALSAAGVGPDAAARAAVVPAQLGPGPAAGMFLIARQDLPDPNFFETVVLLLSYDEAVGAAGVIINRRSPMPVAEAVADDTPLAVRQDPLYQGGPVSVGTLIVLFRGDSPPNGGVEVLDDIFVVREGLSELLSGEPEASALRFYAGYAGWSQGQLEGEISSGGWHLLRGDPSWVFSDRPDQAWQTLQRIAVGPRV